MKTNLLLCALLALLALPMKAQDTAKHPIFSTTLDFLDYCFYDKRGGEEAFTVEAFDSRLKEVADAGIRKVYLRVNCLGLTLYPTKVSVMYGTDGRFHWNCPEQSMRLIRTIGSYDVCAEAIRICHKYGMEAWAWESICDGGGPGYSDIGFEPEYEKYFKQHHGTPFPDPFYVEHPEYLSWRDPKLMPSVEKLKVINAEAIKGNVARILLKDSQATGKLSRVKAEEVEVYVSDDNATYTRYAKPFQCRAYVDKERHSCFEITGLKIPQRYVKIAHPIYEDKNWGLAVRDEHGVSKAFDEKGREIYTTWANLYGEGDKRGNVPFRFGRFEPAGWDYQNYCAGFMRGQPDNETLRYFGGVYEFNCPQAMEHQLARFAELAAYSFDGYMMNYRTHSRSAHPEQYGYNPEVRQAYLKQHGVDIWKKPADPAKLYMIQADGIARFLAGCKKLIGERPLFITGLKPAKPGEKAELCGAMTDDLSQIACRGMSMDMFNRLPWLYHRYLAVDKSVDGIMMTSAYFPEIFTPELTGGRKITVGLYRERPGDNGAYNQKKYDFEADVRRLYTNPDIDEVELYETLDYTSRPERLKLLRELTGGRK